MGNAKDKIIRYKNIFGTLENWGEYLFSKMKGFGQSFTFKVRHFGAIRVETRMLGPFRENFFDNVYFRHIPTSFCQDPEKPVIVDIGANVGFFSLAAFSRLPKARIYAFEPLPFCFNVLSTYQKEFSHFDWHPFHKALSNRAGELTLSTRTATDFTTMASVFEKDSRKESVTVECIPFDAFIEDHKIKQIDFMKVDCEGAEYEILYDLPQTTFDKIRSMCIETHRGHAPQQNHDALHDFLIQKGYNTVAQKESEDVGYIWAWQS